MIKKVTDEILDNPKDRDAKQKTADDAANAREFKKFFNWRCFSWNIIL